LEISGGRQRLRAGSRASSVFDEQAMICGPRGRFRSLGGWRKFPVQKVAAMELRAVVHALSRRLVWEQRKRAKRDDAMDITRLSKLVFVVGVIVVAIAFYQWFDFYGSLTRGEPFIALKCLVYTDQECSQVNRLAAMAGLGAYSPTLFWIGAILTALGGYGSTGGLAAQLSNGGLRITSGKSLSKVLVVCAVVWTGVWGLSWGVQLMNDLPGLSRAEDEGIKRATYCPSCAPGFSNPYNPNLVPEVVARRNRLTKDLLLLGIPLAILLCGALFLRTRKG